MYKIVLFLMTALLISCSGLSVNLKIEVAKEADQNARLIFFFIKEEKKFKELMDKSVTELNSYTLQHLLSEKSAGDVLVEGDIASRLMYNTKESDLCVAVYTFTYRDTDDAKKISGSIKNLNFSFYTPDYPWRIAAYWDDDESRQKKEEIPDSVTLLEITCNKEKGATFQWH